MSLLRLRIAAARYALRHMSNNFSGEELKLGADDALNHGVYSYSLGELATLSVPLLSDAAPLFESALAELEIPLPSTEDAIASLLEHNIRSIVEGAVSPYEGIHRLVHECYYPMIQQEKALTYAGDSRGIQHLYAAYWDYADLDILGYDGKYGPEAANILDGEVVEDAKEWNREHGRVKIDPRWRTSTVVDLAAAIKYESAFDRLPILADALMDAGCDNEDILLHCRGEDNHIRGCWVVDLLLGKE